VSEVIEDYIRRNPSDSEDHAFDGFLKMDRIATWVGNDDGRRERLRREFTRVWSAMHPVVLPKMGPAALEPPKPRETRSTDARPRAPEPKPAHRPTALETKEPPRKLHLLCATCSKMDVWRSDGQFLCRNCGRSYDDLLDLIPVRPVGPFAFMFGDGATGWLTAGGITVGLAALYYLLRSLRWG
jgi:hypothetical protein